MESIEEQRDQLFARLRNLSLSDDQVKLVQQMAVNGRLREMGFDWVQLRSALRDPQDWPLLIATQPAKEPPGSVAQDPELAGQLARNSHEPTTTADEVDSGPRAYVWGDGRRKSAVARVRIATGTGRVTINERELNEYLTNERDRKDVFGPLEVTNAGGTLDVFVNARGGGLTGQTGAIIQGLSRALIEYEKSYEPVLRGAGFMTRDSRMKERKKYGQRGARRRFQFSKR